jgi:methyl-accepting chemotaxis protein
MKKLNLTWMLILGGMMIVIVSILSIGIVVNLETSASLEEYSKNLVQKTSQDIAELVQQTLKQESRMAVEIASGNTAVDTATMVAKEGKEKAADQIENLQRKLITVQKHVGENYETVVAMDLNGVVYADSLGGKLKGLDAGDREYFKQAKQGKCSIGTVSKSKATGNPVTQLAAPIMTDKNEVVGAIVIILKIDYLIDTVVKVKVGQTGYSFMVDQNGLIIAHPDRDQILKLDVRSIQGMENLLKAVQAGETGVIDYTFKGTRKTSGYAPVKITGWSVVATLPYDEIIATIRTMQKQVVTVALILLVLISGVVFILGRRISKPITTAVAGLTDAVEQVSAAAGHVAISSQQLAEGASEQAAAIEETSSSLEEMSSMTRLNAENAKQTNQLMDKTMQTVSRAGQSMERLTASMTEISRASEETSHIIKTIDEIAFQTNLLALNAAVEAARAGEAGAGFAVVADEVRNLAIRAAEAAKNTADLIESTVKKVKEGSGLVADTANEFHEVAESVSSSGELVGGISAASNEQAQGIEQISKAVSEMDKVVQQNAANAEESASASEEMDAQASRMKEFVGSLVSLVGGGGDTAIKTGPARVRGKSMPVFTSQNTLISKNKISNVRNAVKKTAANNKQPSGADAFFPLDDTEASKF